MAFWRGFRVSDLGEFVLARLVPRTKGVIFALSVLGAGARKCKTWSQEDAKSEVLCYSKDDFCPPLGPVGLKLMCEQGFNYVYVAHFHFPWGDFLLFAQ